MFKTGISSALILILLTTLSACSKKEGSSDKAAQPEKLTEGPVNAGGGNSNNGGEDPGSDPNEISDYVGRNLYLMRVGSDSAGWIQIEGADAAAVYNALSLRTRTIKDPTPYVREENTRARENISCVETKQKNEQLPTTYKCRFELNYKTGSINEISNSTKRRWWPRRVKDDYKSDYLFLDSRCRKHFARITLLYEDAQALYEIMGLDESAHRSNDGVPVENNIQEKRTEDIVCTKSIRADEPVSKPIFVCNLYLNYRNGKVIPERD